MFNYKIFGSFLLSIIALFVHCIHFTEAESKSVSACHGTTSTTCHYMTLECNPGSRIRLISMKYGVKNSTCTNKRNRCLDPSQNGCCAYSSGDCLEYYSDLHAYNLYTDCSGKQTCGPLPVPNNILKCANRTSTYVYVTYECVPDEDTLRLCRVDNYDNVNDTQVNVIFSNTVDMFSSPTNCSCFITSQSKIYLDYVDIRMMIAETSGPGSECSTATLTTVPDDNINTKCGNGWNEETNFLRNMLGETDTFVELKLLNLYRNGNADAPEFIWLNIYAKDQNNVNVQCFKHTGSSTPSPPNTTTPKGGTSQPTNTTDSKIPLNGDGGSNTGAIVAGILVPIILLAVVGAIIALCVWKRRGYLCKKQKKHAIPNRYTDRPEIENSHENSEYAEIGFVPDIPNTEPNYDPVYEPKNKKTTNDVNGHTYQNVDNSGKEEGKQSKASKGPLGKLKSHRDRLISFFRNQTENDFPQVKKRDRENSNTEPYDHLRPVSANSEVHVDVTPPCDDPTHTYSHTNDESVKRQVALNKDNDKHVKKTKASPKVEKDADAPTEEVNAFHVGDSYIEFQFGTVDKNHPDLVKHSKEDIENARPAPPSRPPPSPRTAAKCDKTLTPKSSPKQVHPILNVQNETRSKSPNLLSPGHTRPDDAKDYDYAAGTHARPRSVSPRGSDASDVSSEHSYKVLEKQQVYDYADVSDDELAGKGDAYTSGSIYEDVDKDPRSVSVRKHRSATEVPLDTNGYLEPVTSRARAISSPGVNTDLEKDKIKSNKQASAADLLKRELIEKTLQKQQSKSPHENKNKSNMGINSRASNKQNASDDNDAVKSDNIDTKDYQKVDEVKGVMKMAKIFENKDSDSESSRQSSPRNIQVTNHAKSNLHFKTSDA